MKGRVALVTGAGRGIGRSTAIALARAGAAVAITARSAHELDETAAAIGPAAAGVCTIVADLADRRAIPGIVERATEALGPIGILVNNAGVGASVDPRPLVDFADATWDMTIAVNLTAPYLLCKAVLPAMLARRWGRVINIASINARTGSPHGSAYAASKSGLLGLTRSLALEVAAAGVTVNAVSPGPVRTATSDARLRQIAAERSVTLESFEASLTPIGRRLEPQEIANVVVFLAGEEGAGVTGKEWVVDGGTIPL